MRDWREIVKQIRRPTEPAVCLIKARGVRRRNEALMAPATVLALAVTCGALSSRSQEQGNEARAFLRESSYPEQLYEWQRQLKTLEFLYPLDLERFSWLRSNSIQELRVRDYEKNVPASSFARNISMREFANLASRSG